MRPPARSSRVLFGAFDRHNFGDLLFPHLMAALLPGSLYEFPVWWSVICRPSAGTRWARFPPGGTHHRPT